MYHKDCQTYDPGPDGWDGTYPGETMTTEVRYVVKAIHEDPAARAMDVYQISGPWPSREEAETALNRLKSEWEDCTLRVDTVTIDTTERHDAGDA